MADAPGFLEADAAGFAHADYPRYSPDGRWLAFRSAYALILVDRQTGRARRLEAPGGVSLGNTPPVWGSVSAGC
jgi:Tol biopolymer transport system component